MVGADGADSFVRRVTVGGGGDDGDATPERRGYVVYRGVCAGSAVGCEGREGGAQEQWGSESFQTWGPGLRFASVPLAGDERVSTYGFVYDAWSLLLLSAGNIGMDNLK